MSFLGLKGFQVVRTEVYSGDSTKSDDFESRMQYTYTVDNQVSTLSYQEKDEEIRTYTYDAGGNILTETVNGTKHTYKYDSVWKDKLISYDGKDITYNELGCPVNYMGSTMKWDVNGSLSEIKKGGTTITYTYM